MTRSRSPRLGFSLLLSAIAWIAICTTNRIGHQDHNAKIVSGHEGAD